MRRLLVLLLAAAALGFVTAPMPAVDTHCREHEDLAVRATERAEFVEMIDALRRAVVSAMNSDNAHQ